MAYDVDLAARIRTLVMSEAGISERRMFGGLAFLVDGNMAVAAGSGGALMVRIDPADADRLVVRAGTRPMEMRGRPLRGWLLVDATAIGTTRQLRTWVQTGVRFARTLPAKTVSPGRR